MSLPFESRAMEFLKQEIVKDLQRLHEEFPNQIDTASVDKTSIQCARQAGEIKYAKHVLERLFKHVNDRMNEKKKVD